jgi:uncharacterized membrane protein
MKKILVVLLTLLFAFSFGITAFAGDEVDSATEVTQDASQPRLMVTDFSVDGDNLTAGKKSNITITFKNYSKTKAVKNIKLSLTEDTGDVKSVGTGTQYVDYIGAGRTYTWTVKLTASKTATVGEHAITVSSEYEDKYYAQYSSSDILRVNVKQSVGLDYSGIQLPTKSVQGDTITVDISLMNTGKSNIRNCKIDFDIDSLDSGGTTYVGEIVAGENATTNANLRVSSDKLGEVSGKITISYEDEFAKEYKKEIDASTTIVAPTVATDEDEEDEKSNSYWWAFLIGGIVVGGGIGCAIPITIYSHKQRKEDELRL